MKIALSFMLIALSQLAWAMPYRCVSNETIDGVAIVNAKINSERLVDGFYQFLIGMTPAKGLRFTTYGQGHVTETSIGLTFVDDHFVVGSLSARDEIEDGILEGVLAHGKLKRRPVPVRCYDLSKHKI
jgi:hypothetical protein